MMVLQLLNRNYENVFLCVLTLVLLVAPSFVQVTFKVELPTTLEIIILVFIFAAEILGEISEFYLMFPFWDTVLHTLNGDRLFSCGSSEPQREDGVQSVASVYGDRCILFLYDDRRAVGIL